MGTNKYFNQYPGNITQEQLLVEDLINEAVQINGSDNYYLPRNYLANTETDMIYGEDVTSWFNKAFPMEMYIEPTMGFEGRHDFFSKFGLAIEDTTKVILTRRTFGRYSQNLVRPREGDLVYVPALSKLFEIKFVNEEKDFYTLGRRKPLFYYYELSLEAFKFNNERFNTGIPEIDSIATNYSYTLQLNLLSGANNFIKGETTYQGANVASATASATVKGWDKRNKVLSLITVKGVFSNSANVVGATSGSNWIINNSFENDFDGKLDELADNLNLDTEAAEVITFTEENPFGEPI